MKIFTYNKMFNYFQCLQYVPYNWGSIVVVIVC